MRQICPPTYHVKIVPDTPVITLMTWPGCHNLHCPIRLVRSRNEKRLHYPVVSRAPVSGTLPFGPTAHRASEIDEWWILTQQCEPWWGLQLTCRGTKGHANRQENVMQRRHGRALDRLFNRTSWASAPASMDSQAPQVALFSRHDDSPSRSRPVTSECVRTRPERRHGRTGRDG